MSTKPLVAMVYAPDYGGISEIISDQEITFIYVDDNCPHDRLFFRNVAPEPDRLIELLNKNSLISRAKRVRKKKRKKGKRA